MKYSLIIAMICIGLLSHAVRAQQTIDRPSYRFRNTGIYRVGRIELSETATRLQLLSEFIPGWWVIFSKEKTCVEDPRTGQKYLATDVQGIQWGQKKTTPKSGVDTFYFTFPPLPKGIKEIDLKAGGGGIYGIVLDKDKQKASAFPPQFAGNWYGTDGSWQVGFYDDFALLNNKFWDYQNIRVKGKKVYLTLKNNDEQKQLSLTLQKDGNCRIGADHKDNRFFSRQKTATPIKHEQNQPFFQPGSKAIVQGYLHGYDTLAGFTTGIIYHCNNITDEDRPTAVTIRPDGRFEAELSLDFPTLNSIYFERVPLSFYTAPMDTLTIYLEWEDFLQTNRYRNRTFNEFGTLEFMGKTAHINRDIAKTNILLPEVNQHDALSVAKKVSPGERLKRQTRQYHSVMDSLKILAKQYNFSPESMKIIAGKIYNDYGLSLLDFLMYRKDAGPDPGNKALSEPLKPSYFHFLKETDLNNEYLLVPYMFYFFINRMEFNTPFREALYAGYPQPALTQEQYALNTFTDLTPEERLLLDTLLQPIELSHESIKIRNAQVTRSRKIWERHEKDMQEYERIYIETLPQYTDFQRLLIKYQAMSSVLKDTMGLDHNLVYDIMMLHNLRNDLKDEQLSRQQVDSITEMMHITHPYVQSLQEKLVNQAYAPQKAYKLPDTKAADIFRKIVAPYKGKIVFVDFWATSCGPCRSGIKRMEPLREKYQGKEVAFVFITDEKSSPLEAYNSFMKEVKGYKYRIPESDYNYLRELFRFNGIPRYVLLDRNGDVLDDNFNRDPESTLEQLLK